MVYFTNSNDTEISTHINSPDPIPSDWIKVWEVQADGDELEAIRNQTTGIKMTTGRVITFVGDDAQFIFANRRHIFGFKPNTL